MRCEHCKFCLKEGVMYYCSRMRIAFLPEKTGCQLGDDPRIDQKIKTCPICKTELGLVKKSISDDPYYVCGNCMKTFKIEVVDPPFIEDLY